MTSTVQMRDHNGERGPVPWRGTTGRVYRCEWQVWTGWRDRLDSWMAKRARR